MRLARFWLIVHVRLRQPIETADEGGTGQQLVGYYQDFGVTAWSEEEARETVRSVIEDGEIDWANSTCDVSDFEHLDRSVRARSSDPDLAGIWYKSGRGFYPRPHGEGDEEDQGAPGGQSRGGWGQP